MKNILIVIIKFYKKLSIYKKQSCRFYPSCSQYSLDAINKYGPLQGLLKSVFRIAKCNQWNPGGFDPLT